VDTFKDELTAMVVNLIAEVNAMNVTHKIFAVDKVVESIETTVAKKEKKSGVSTSSTASIPKPKKVFNPNEVICPKCKNKGLISGKSALGCSNWKNGCDFKIPYEIGGKKMTGVIIEQLISKGKSSLQKDLKENGKAGEGYYKLLNGMIAIEWK
jgi:DNA topoisomerase-3